MRSQSSYDKYKSEKIPRSKSSSKIHKATNSIISNTTLTTKSSERLEVGSKFNLLEKKVY